MLLHVRGDLFSQANLPQPIFEMIDTFFYSCTDICSWFYFLSRIEFFISFSVTPAASPQAKRRCLTDLLPQGVELTQDSRLPLQISHLIWVEDVPPTATHSQWVTMAGIPRPPCPRKTQYVPDSWLWLEDSTMVLPSWMFTRLQDNLENVHLLSFYPVSDVQVTWWLS